MSTHKENIISGLGLMRKVIKNLSRQMNDGGPSSFFTELKINKNRIVINLTSFLTADDGVEKIEKSRR